MLKKYSNIIISGFLLFLTLNVVAQKTRQQLEKEKRENLEKMNEVKSILNQTTTQKKANLGQLRAISRQIETQHKKVELISEDIDLMDSELKELEVAKQELDKDLVKLKAEYAQMIYTTSKRNNNLSMLSFLFSAPSFNQFWARYKYLRQYTDERQKQVTQMKRVQQLMTDKTDRITGKKTDQQRALEAKVAESKNLEGLKLKQNEVVKELGKRESELKVELAEIRKANRDLENSIVTTIRREMQERRAREKAAAKERAERERAAARAAELEKAASGKTENVAKVETKPKVEPEPAPEPRNSDGMNEAEVALASSFEASKGRLPWPVKSGFISDKYGSHEYIAGQPVTNSGIGIQTNEGEVVRAVYDGEVVDVESAGIYHNTIFIQHGNYYSIYTKVKGVSVRRGQKVKAREPIAVVATSKDGVSELNFQIWKNENKTNPENWLAPR